MVVIRVLIFLVFGFGPLVVFGARGQGHFEGLSEAEIAFVQAIRNHDELALRGLLLNPDDFFDGSQLVSEIAIPIWDGDNFRARHPGWSGLQSIGELSEYDNLKAMRAEQLDGSVIVSFVPELFVVKVDMPAFFSEEWLISYFACRFRKTELGWKIVDLCFASSHGPYVEPYG